MNFLDIFISIVEIVVILAVLISLHEAGHLAVAKAFNVYCFEYSIGFGPKLIHKKKKGGETYFSLRAIPLGGFVSMYGEDGQVPEGYEAPPTERSLQAKPAYQKALIQVAGVTVNFILGLILIFISDSCFPQFYSAYGRSVEVSGYAESEITAYFAPANYDGELLSYIEAHKEEGYNAQDYVISMPATVLEGQAIMISDNVTISGVDGTYCAVYYPTTLRQEHLLSSSLRLYKASSDPLPAYLEEIGVKNLPDSSLLEAGTYYDFSGSEDGVYATVELCLVGIPSEGEAVYGDQLKNHSLRASTVCTVKSKALTGSDCTLEVIKHWLGWGGAWKQWASDVPYACGAIVKGFASLFTPSGFKNLSGIVGMTAALPQISAIGGWARIFFFAGIISINLAFFNLLPFPGLDGWALIMTLYEKIRRKKIPAKVQGIVSLVGYILLAALMVAVTVKDIIQLFI